ncbi:unnamed protein product, partial [Polarella glacialis]
DDGHRLSWSDLESGRYELLPDADVVIIDRVTYAGNVGSVLRHMPVFGAQVIFLTHSTHDPSSPYPSYPRKFVKEAMRVSMARHYEEFSSKLCVLESGGVDEVSKLLAFLKERGFKLLALENVEAFEDINSASATASSSPGVSGVAVEVAAKPVPHHSIYEEGSILRDVSTPMAFIFGGEVGGIPPALLATCDAGGYIPSRVGGNPRASQLTADCDQQSYKNFWSTEGNARTLSGEQMEGTVQDDDASSEIASRPFLRTHS